MVDEILPRLRDRRTAMGRPSLAMLTRLGFGILACGCAWSDPARNGWASAALMAALALDQGGLMAEARATARHGSEARLGGVPSIVLALEHGAVRSVGSVLFAATVLVWPTSFALLASALAGLVALRAVARLALARIVLQTATSEDHGTRCARPEDRSR